MALSVLPALVILLVDRRLRLAPVWKEFVLAGALALLLSAVLWVPVAHFWPNLGKDTDPGFQSAQPIFYSALNLVINNVDFYYTTDLGKLPYPYLYTNYIGAGAGAAGAGRAAARAARAHGVCYFSF